MEALAASSLLLERPNLLERQRERWRPPLFATSRNRSRRLLDAARRLLDLQAASLWTDLKSLLPNCHGTVLDVGCGSQPYRRLLPPDAVYLGIDTAEAKQQFGYDVPDTQYFAGTVWPVADSTVDFVLTTETLEHVVDPQQFSSEAHRCLRAGGALILTVPFAARWHYIPYDYWRFTPSALERLLTGAGFAEVRVFARGNETTVACYKIMALILSLLGGNGGGFTRRLLRRAAGLLWSPLLVPLALVAHGSLRGRSGDDCLGYTVLARRSGQATGSKDSSPAARTCERTR